MLNAGFVLLGRTRALVDDFGEIIYAGPKNRSFSMEACQRDKMIKRTE
jgi:hypothetical protein